MSATKSSGRGELLLLFVVTVWGTTFVLVKEALDTWPPFPLLAARFGLGALPFLPILARKNAVDRETLRRGLLLGVLFFLSFALQTLGLRWTSPARSAFFSAVTVPLVPPLRYLMTRERPARGTFVALAAGCAGILLLLGRDIEPTVRLGDLLTLGCALSFAFVVIALSEFSRRSPLLPLTGIQLAATALLACGATIATGERFPAPITTALPHVVYLGIFATAVTVFAQVVGQRETSVHRAAFIFALEPVMAALFAWIARGHLLAGREIIGGGLLVIAAIVADRPLGERAGPTP